MGVYLNNCILRFHKESDIPKGASYTFKQKSVNVGQLFLEFHKEPHMSVCA